MLMPYIRTVATQLQYMLISHRLFNEQLMETGVNYRRLYRFDLTN